MSSFTLCLGLNHIPFSIEAQWGEVAIAQSFNPSQLVQQGIAEYRAGNVLNAIASWQTAIDRLEQIPAETLAGQTARTKVTTVQRDFQQVAGAIAQDARTNTWIAAAQQFATAAEKAAQNPPHAVTKWEGVVDLWEQAITRLQQVEADDPGYIEAQSSLANYKINLTAVRTQLHAERPLTPTSAFR